MNNNSRKSGSPEIKITSLKSVIAWLTPYAKTIDNPNDLLAIETIMNEIGKCPSCKGSGERNVSIQPDSNYKVRITPRKEKYFLIQCLDCKGLGKILEINCVSCGNKADRLPAQRHLNYCNGCEVKLTASGIIY